MANSIVITYVDAAIAQRQRLGLMRFPGVIPEPMRDRSIRSSKDWSGWKAIPSSVTNTDLDAIEQETGLAFPPAYRDFLQYRHFVELTHVGVRFERHLCHTWKETLRNAYFRSWRRDRIIDVGLLPFGVESLMDAGPVCFDTRRRASNGDCPVVFWDHEYVGTAEEIKPMFSDSCAMFACLTFVAQNDVDFLHEDDDDRLLQEQKEDLLRRFLSIDAGGAGGPAREYWTSWGVTP